MDSVSSEYDGFDYDCYDNFLDDLHESTQDKKFIPLCNFESVCIPAVALEGLNIFMEAAKGRVLFKNCPPGKI